MFTRFASPILNDRLGEFPAVALLGPRQCGKTTLARTLLSKEGAVFFDLENPIDRTALDDPLLALRAYADRLVVIDEAQRYPELFPILRVLIDEDRRPGRFLLLGSATPDLRCQSAESLVGRLYNLELTPLLWREIKDDITLDDYWLAGGFPESILSRGKGTSTRWRTNYLRAVVDRDLPLLGFQVEPKRMWRFVQMLAHHHGQLWNASQIASKMVISASSAGSSATAGTFPVPPDVPPAVKLREPLS
jgi:hypothetical protein